MRSARLIAAIAVMAGIGSVMQSNGGSKAGVETLARNIAVEL